jgi:hypothetical protein
MKAGLGLPALALGVLLAQPLSAGVSELEARLSCEHSAGPGRVLCELTTRAPTGKLVWSDALVVRAPGFARPLRSRFVAQLGASSEKGAAWAKLALVASGPGQGQLELLARGVVCHDEPTGESCRAVAVPVSAALVVGAGAAPAPAPAP